MYNISLRILNNGADAEDVMQESDLNAGEVTVAMFLAYRNSAGERFVKIFPDAP